MLDTLGQPNQKAEFTKEMLQTMLEYFSYYSDGDDVLTIDINSQGIWVNNPMNGAMQFIGKARYSALDIKNMHRAKEERKSNS